MKISTKGRYSLMFLIDLAQHGDEGFIALNDVASRKNISKKYLEQIVPILNKAGLLQANRGAKGGYCLAKSPDSISVGDILKVTENIFMPETAQTDPNEEVLSLFIWNGLDDVIEKYLDGITIQDILDKQTVYYSNNYII
ncbi:MAG: Rrf2 family transcriptional regulator [Clostridiales bacterium]|nr:Rrf2 family transcriptional regulator [Clostridiales bacterium]MDU3490868.1 Rrf2 family transcriptional regulator [Clostridiales bacterium]